MLCWASAHGHSAFAHLGQAEAIVACSGAVSGMHNVLHKLVAHFLVIISPSALSRSVGTPASASRLVPGSGCHVLLQHDWIILLIPVTVLGWILGKITTRGMALGGKTSLVFDGSTQELWT